MSSPETHSEAEAEMPRASSVIRKISTWITQQFTQEDEGGFDNLGIFAEVPGVVGIEESRLRRGPAESPQKIKLR